jgi:CHAT domain-containing protein
VISNYPYLELLSVKTKQLEPRSISEELDSIIRNSSVRSGQFYVNGAKKQVEIARRSGDPLAYGRALNDLGLSYKYSSEYLKAEQSLMEAIAIWEKLRVGLEDQEFYRVSLFETQTVTYQSLQQVRIAMQKYPEALEALEQGRARAFLALLSSKLSRTEKYTEPPVTVKQLQQIARDQQITIISYSLIKSAGIGSLQPLLGSAELYAWVIAPDGKISFRKIDLPMWEIENGKSLIETIEDLQERLGRPSGTIRIAGATTANPRKPPQNYDDSPDELKKLYQLLIKPIEEFLPTDPEAKIVFIPHQALFLVPFAALREQSGKYLIEKHTIAYSPSIQVLAYTEKLRDRNQGSGELLVGNPTGDLKSAELEVNAIAQFFNTKAIIGKDATKAVILTKISDARIIHLATHGKPDDNNGLNSEIFLAPNGKTPITLTAAEILKLNLKAELAVLSACNTANGKITGDGVIGLSRAFILAGTPSIIVTLWSIPDAETGKLMPEFYRNLQTNSDRAQALRQAMLTTKRDYPHPRNWAAFTLIGARK